MHARTPPAEQPVAPALQAWLASRLPGRGPFTMTRLPGGNSNQTYTLADAEGTLVLRRPPDTAVDSSAHDVLREHRLLVALEHSDAPSARPIALCTDADVLGVPFLVMEHIEGHSMTDALPADSPPQPEAARQIGLAVVDALVRLHAVDWRAAGLEGFGKPDGFLERQVPRWRAQYERVRVRELPRFDEVGDWLERHRPATYAPGILHGDFHVDNCLIAFAPEAEVRAIIDWEMTTIGDPLLDVGLLLGLWGDEDPAAPPLSGTQGITKVPGSPTRAELAERYAAQATRDLDDLHWYVVLALWKVAAVIEGAYSNLVAHGDDRSYTRALESDVPALVAQAAAIADRGGIS